MYLVDTNVWLELLLDQVKSPEVAAFLKRIPPDRLSVTDFAFHSIALVLCRLDCRAALLRFVEDVFADAGVALVRLEPSDTHYVLRVMERFNLDFDDAYQYVAAEKHGLRLVSLDADFDRTELGRTTPERILQS